jgi:ubiquinone/menaquinone biosynthesis C-methylase UbiE
MSLKVLQNMDEVVAARQALVEMGGSAIEQPFAQKLRRIGLNRSIKLGDSLKSWDVLATLNFLRENVGKEEKILDIGCFASEVPVSLHQLGFKNVSGIDLNKRVRNMPFSDQIDYRVGNFMETPFDDGTFKAVTSISVIEHGLDQTKLLKEMSRILQPGGFLLTSFDYWIDKIDTNSIKIFDLSWLIFSQKDIEAFVAEAAEFGFEPVDSLDFSCSERPVQCFGKDYTFGWLALHKTAE